MSTGSEDRGLAPISCVSHDRRNRSVSSDGSCARMVPRPRRVEGPTVRSRTGCPQPPTRHVEPRLVSRPVRRRRTRPCAKRSPPQDITRPIGPTQPPALRLARCLSRRRLPLHGVPPRSGATLPDQPRPRIPQGALVGHMSARNVAVARNGRLALRRRQVRPYERLAGRQDPGVNGGACHAASWRFVFRSGMWGFR
jgi:hypothetical protein